MCSLTLPDGQGAAKRPKLITTMCHIYYCTYACDRTIWAMREAMRSATAAAQIVATDARESISTGTLSMADTKTTACDQT
jgi:hypothetical protein